VNAIKMSRKAINRIKVVLVEKNLSNKWLAEQLGKNEATISIWCANDVQPPLKTLKKTIEVLKVDVSDLLNKMQI
jgi:putative transcriptional regulator